MVAMFRLFYSGPHGVRVTVNDVTMTWTQSQRCNEHNCNHVNSIITLFYATTFPRYYSKPVSCRLDFSIVFRYYSNIPFLAGLTSV